MPSYRFQFTDARGQILEGTLVAASPSEAEAVLRQRGYPNVSLIGAPSAGAATAAPPIVSPPPAMSTPVQAPPASASRPVVTDQTRQRAIRTRKGSDKQRFFLFSQFSKLLNAGIAPARAFDEVAKVTPYEHYRASFRAMAEDSTNGRPLSGTMERYPNLYPDHVVGMVRAGEAGGFLPEAFAELSRHAEEAYKFKRFHWFIWYLIPRAVIALPIAMAFAATLRRAAAEGSGELIRIFGEYLVWPYGPAAIALAALMLLARWVFGMHGMRHWRHALGLRAPMYGARARNESIAIFTWTLSHLAKAGVPPNTSWALAKEAVPNLEMQARLQDAGSRMHSGSRLSEVVFGSKLFPDEYAPVLTTGEMVGDVPGALEQLEKVSRVEFEETTRKARWGSMRIGMVFAIATSGCIVIMVAKAWYVDVIKTFAPEIFEWIGAHAHI